VTTTRRPGWRELTAAVIGGVLGTGARLAIDVAFAAEGFPWHTLVINVLGSFVLGALVGTLWARPTTPPWLKAGVGVGVLGSFTTFSAVMVSAVSLSSADEWLLAVGYLVASVALGLGAAALGLLVGRLNTTIGVDE
jgi:CrcB protein